MAVPINSFGYLRDDDTVEVMNGTPVETVISKRLRLMSVEERTNYIQLLYTLNNYPGGKEAIDSFVAAAVAGLAVTVYNADGKEINTGNPGITGNTNIIIIVLVVAAIAAVFFMKGKK
jgi:hypothetical protein